MPDITKEEKTARDVLITKSYTYLNDNFHKFTEGSKIRIALEIIKKSMPTFIDHSGEVNFTQMATIMVEAKPMDLDLGEDMPPKNRIAGKLDD